LAVAAGVVGVVAEVVGAVVVVGAAVVVGAGVVVAGWIL
jgi:hypothetical protein